jgi:glycosyltransferase involved in cell wall biosynthesis
MKLLFVCKRRPQQRDLFTRPYGRFHHLPAGLAALGHEVTLVLIGHAGDAPAGDTHEGVQRITCDLRSQGPVRTWRKLRDLAKAQRPDWVVGLSDAWTGWFAHRAAQAADARLCIDAYDNYEAYMAWNWPLHRLWRRALAHAELVTAAGPQLAQLLARHRGQREAPRILPMAADPAFVPRDQAASRAQLGLPAEGRWLGYSGGWGKSRGTDVIPAAYLRARETDPGLGLLLTGRPPAQVLALPGVRGLGYIDDALLPAYVSALDAPLVVTAHTGFGDYSYPAKLCEAMACARPVAATDTAPVRWMLGEHTRFLAPVGDVGQLARVALDSAALGHFDYGALPSWRQASAQLDGWLRAG